MEFLRNITDIAHRQVVYRALNLGTNGDAEVAHERALYALERLDEDAPMLELLRGFFTYNDPVLVHEAGGLTFQRVTGVPAGFDKNVRCPRALGAFGPGSVEEGTITWLAYPGNPKPPEAKIPRMEEYPLDFAVRNSLGFPGEGTARAIARLKQKGEPSTSEKRGFVLGVNFGVSRQSFIDGRILPDLLAAYRDLRPYGDYKVLNPSSPNTKGLRGLEEPKVLDETLDALDEVIEDGEIVLVKLSPDLPLDKLADDVEIIRRHKSRGLILGNTTVDQAIVGRLRSPNRDRAGGFSGEPLFQRAVDRNAFVTDLLGGVDAPRDFIRFGAGGVTCSVDAWNMVSFGGVDHVPALSGRVMPHSSTPFFDYYINRDVARGLRALGMKSLSELKYTNTFYPAHLL